MAHFPSTSAFFSFLIFFSCDYCADGTRLFRGSSSGIVERLVFSHMDSKGHFRREFVARGGAAVHSMLAVGGAGCGIRGVTDALLVGDDDGTVRMFDFTKREQEQGSRRDAGAGDGGSRGRCKVEVLWQVRLGVEEAPQHAQPSDAQAAPADAITSLLLVPELGQLVVASAAGPVVVLDPLTGRRLAALAVPDMEEEEPLGEPLSLAFERASYQLLVSFQSGTVLAWKWGAWDMVSARAPAHTASAVNCIESLDETRLVTAGDDGVLRLLCMHPPRVLAVLAPHASDVKKLQVTSGVTSVWENRENGY